MPLETLWSNGNHTHGVKNSGKKKKKKKKEQDELQKITTKQQQSGKACWKIQMQRTKGKERGSPRRAGKHLHHEGFQKKETLPPPSPWKQLKVHFLTDQKKQENKCFLSFVFPSCHPTSFTSKHVTAQNRMLILWHKLEQRQDDANNHGGKINRFSSNFWGLLLSTQTGGGIKGGQLFSLYNSRAPALQQRAQ